MPSFTIGTRYSVDDVWNTLQVPAADRTIDWLSGVHLYDGFVYALCSRFRGNEKPHSHTARLRLGQLYWRGERGSSLSVRVARSLLHSDQCVHLFFSGAETSDFEYLGRGILQGMDAIGIDTPALSWEVDRGDGILCLRKHCDALRQVCAFDLADGSDDPILDAVELLELAAAIDEVQIDTVEFGTGTMWDSGWRHYESVRSDLLSDIVTSFTVFTYIWMALEAVLETFRLPPVPRSLKQGGASPVDRALYHMQQGAPDDNDCSLMPGYIESINHLHELLVQDDRYCDMEKEFMVLPHMNRWGIGLHVVRKLRNKLLHGALRLPEPAEWSGQEPRDMLLFEMSDRVVLLSVQLLLSLEHAWRGTTPGVDSGTAAAGDCVGTSLRRLHLRA